MPNYGFVCEGCNHNFDILLPISERDKPLSNPCPSCGGGKIVKDFGSMRQSLSSDSLYNANKATGGQWNELMSRMKNRIPKRYHENLDSASSRTGRKWSG
jgi:putative FmdB family regulatory protein